MHSREVAPQPFAGVAVRLHLALEGWWRQHVAVYERRQLRDRPWLEEVLHWSADGQLHGRLSPPEHGPDRSVTSDGWCPGSTEARGAR